MTRLRNYAKKTTFTKKTAPLLEGPCIRSVSIIVLVFNQWKHTMRCLQSVLTNTNATNLEVIVVDNGSTDETVVRLSKWGHPALKVIKSPENLGFSGGNNLGYKHARGEFLILLNNDTIVPPGWLERLLKPLVKNCEIGLTGPVTNNSSNDQKLDLPICERDVGVDAVWLSEFYRFNWGNIRFTDFLAFFCVALRKSVFDKVGELDENFTIGLFEDNDYCERVRSAGFKLAVVEDCFVYHHGSGSLHEMDPILFQNILQNNRDYYERKWQKPYQPALLSPSFQNSNSQQVADSITATGKRCVLLLTGTPWWGVVNRTMKFAEELLRDGVLLVVYTPAYYGKKIYGIRQAGPSFLLTNSTELLEKCIIDTVIYCGERIVHSNLQFKKAIIDRLSYNQKELQLIRACLYPQQIKELQ